MYQQALETKEKDLYYFETRDDMMEELPRILRKGDTILVKASHGMQFEKVVEQIKEEAD